MRNCPEWIITFWACHLLGAVSTQVNAWLPIKPFMHCLTHSGAKVVVVDPERAAMLAPRISSLRSDARVLLATANGGISRGNLRRHNGMRLFDAVIDAYAGPPEAWRKERECALDDNGTIFFTSGTTGLPKGVLSTQRSFMHGYMVNAYVRDHNLVRQGYPPLGTPDPAWERTCMLGVPLFHVTGTTSSLVSWVGSLDRISLSAVCRWGALTTASNSSSFGRCVCTLHRSPVCIHWNSAFSGIRTQVQVAPSNFQKS